jgi:hypothetical protein
VHVQVLEKLQAIFAGFEENGSEPLYIIMGSFISKPLARALGGRETIQAAFDALAEVIGKFPRQAENAKFLLVPGTIHNCMISASNGRRHRYFVNDLDLCFPRIGAMY